MFRQKNNVLCLNQIKFLGFYFVWILQVWRDITFEMGLQGMRQYLPLALIFQLPLCKWIDLSQAKVKPV